MGTSIGIRIVDCEPNDKATLKELGKFDKILNEEYGFRFHSLYAFRKVGEDSEPGDKFWERIIELGKKFPQFTFEIHDERHEEYVWLMHEGMIVARKKIFKAFPLTKIVSGVNYGPPLVDSEDCDWSVQFEEEKR